MKEPVEPSVPKAPETHSSLLGLLFRLYWMGIGNAILLMSAIYIIANKISGFSLVDILFWANAVLMVVLRYVDIAFLKGDTTEGAPATMQDWRVYSLGLTAAAAGIWLFAHALGFFHSALMPVGFIP